MKLKLFSGLNLPRLTAPACLGLAVIATAIVICQSVLPAGDSQGVPHFDKVMHFGSYFILVGLWAIAFRLKSLPAVVTAVAVLGIGLEIAQHMMNLGRTGSIWDTLANFAGCLAAAFAVRALIDSRGDDMPIGKRQNA